MISKINKLSLLNQLELSVGNNVSFSILENEKPDAFHIEKSNSENFIVFYLDDRGNRQYETICSSFEEASKFLLELIKSLS